MDVNLLAVDGKDYIEIIVSPSSYGFNMNARNSVIYKRMCGKIILVLINDERGYFNE